jgi:5-methylcytosine-specific restriction endonuclease McrA
VSLDLIESFEFVEPGPTARYKMLDRSKRAFIMANLKKIEPDMLCAWCNARPIDTKPRKYCKDRACLDSALVYCIPHSPKARMYVLIYRQSCACAICGLSYLEEIEKRARRLKERNDELQAKWPDKNYTGKVPLYQVGYNWGAMMHVDHTIPIFKGGDGFGFENIQIVCASCHMTKTARERK